MTKGMVSPDGYLIEDQYDDKGKWKGYRCSVIPVAEGAEYQQLHPLNIELKKDPNKHITPDSFQKA